MNDEPTLSDVMSALWMSRWWVVVIILAATSAATVTALVLPKKYDASVLVLPVSDAGTGQLSGLGGLASQFSGLASLAGVTIPTDSKKTEAVAVLQSEALTERYIAANNLLPVLYASKWDSASGRWKSTDPQKIPTLWKANRYFSRSIRSVSIDTKTGAVTLKISWKDPQLAAKWANDLVRLTNDYLRDQAIELSERNIAYLNDQSSKTDVIGIRQAIYSIMQSEFNKAMLARGSNEYALKVLDPARPPDLVSFPIVWVWAVGGCVFGLAVSTIVAVRRARNRRRRGANE
jgi:uncharacterized protein involved in exopolysaccharide biosynthesis